MSKYIAVVFDQTEPLDPINHEEANRSDIAYERYHDLVDRHPHNIVRLYDTATRTVLTETIPTAE